MICTTFLGRHVSATDKIGPFIVLYFGIGVRRAAMFCKVSGISYSHNLSNLSEHKVAYIENLVEISCPKEFELRREVSSNIYFKYSSGFLAGLRMSQGLPAKKQRTKTNAQTAKKRKIDFTKFSK
jgi:small subunit ribosomal protein S13